MLIELSESELGTIKIALAENAYTNHKKGFAALCKAEDAVRDSITLQMEEAEYNRRQEKA